MNTIEEQTAHLQVGLCRCFGPRPQMRTARQGSIRSRAFGHGRVIEFTCRRSDLWLASSARVWLRISLSINRWLPAQPAGCVFRLTRAAGGCGRWSGSNTTSRVNVSSPCTCHTRLERSTPARATSARAISTMDFPFPLGLNFRKSILVPRYRLRVGEVPSHSLKSSVNGRAPGPGRRYAVHSRQPDPGALPSSLAQLARPHA